MTESLTLYEGGDTKYVVFKSLVPQRLFCPLSNRNNCSVNVRAYLRASKEKKCPDGREVTQAVIPWMGSTLSTDQVCGSAITMETWSTNMQIPVKAKMDGMKDKDQTRSLQIQVGIKGDGFTNMVYDIDRVQLKIKDMDKSAKCSSINDPHMKTFDKK